MAQAVRERAKTLSDDDLQDVTEELARELLTVWDANGDGKLNMTESKSMMLDHANAMIKSGPKAYADRAKERLGPDGKVTDLEIQMTYRGIDWDKSGGLEVEEVQKSVGDLLISIRKAALEGQ